MMTLKNTEQAVLSIAGSDPSGGAGIQADIKTFTDIGVYGGAVVSCLTAQNTRGVFRIEPVPADMVREQITHVLDDLDVTHIKIGMLGSGTVAANICDALSGYTGEIIFDPVLTSSGGRDLIDPQGHTVIRKQLLPICTVITPNIPELSALSEKECATGDMLQSAAESLLQAYEKLRSVIITGGHFRTGEKTVTDLLLRKSAAAGQAFCEDYSHQRIDSKNTHGTGCTFSAAFTAYHFLTGDDSESFRLSCRYMDTLIRKSVPAKVGQGTGPLMHHLK